MDHLGGCASAHPQGLVEGGALQRPAWLNLAVHVVNSVVAWTDLLIGELAGGQAGAPGPCSCPALCAALESSPS